MKNLHLKLCLVTHRSSCSLQDYTQFLQKAAAAGITSLQLRDKSNNLDELYREAMAFKKILSPYGIPLIINDHVELALAVNAEGVHLGQTDLSPEKARLLLGPDKIIGLSIETIEELKKANQLACVDYVAASAVFPSKSKPDCKTHWGFEGLKQLIAASKHPVIAIGGIKQTNIRQIIELGACGVAVIGAIHDAPQPEIATRHLLDAIHEAEQEELRHVYRYK